MVVANKRILALFTLVLIICSRRGEDAGRSPAPTIATKDVLKSISTIPTELSANQRRDNRRLFVRQQTMATLQYIALLSRGHTFGIALPERVAVVNLETILCPDRYATIWRKEKRKRVGNRKHKNES